LPLAQTELLEVLVALRVSDDAEIADAAKETLQSQSPEDLLICSQRRRDAGKCPRLSVYTLRQYARDSRSRNSQQQNAGRGSRQPGVVDIG